jgi:hypothetical protein
LVGSTCVDSAVVSFSTISKFALTSKPCSAGAMTLASGNERMMLPPKLTSARMLPAAISPGSAAQGQSPMMPDTSGMVGAPGENGLSRIGSSKLSN